MKKTFLLSLVLILFCWLPTIAQIQDPVQFKSEWKTVSETEAQIVFTGKIDAGWHIYSTNLEGGPISATFNTDKMEGLELIGQLSTEGHEIEKFDPMFEMKVRYFEEKVIFIQNLKITAPTYFIEGYLEYGACNDENCLPPSEIGFTFSGKGENKTENTQTIDNQVTAQSISKVSTSDYWEPVIDKLNAM